MEMARTRLQKGGSDCTGNTRWMEETWMRTMRREAGEECWEDLEELAQDRWWWREFIEALCIPQGATGGDIYIYIYIYI